MGITIIFFSTYEVVGRTLVGKIDPVQLNFIRFFFGGLILLPAAQLELKKKNFKINAMDLIQMALLGLLLVGVSMNLLQYGLNQTRANLAAVLFSSNPLFVTLTAALVLDEQFSLRKLLGLGLGFVGVAVIFFDNGATGTIYFRGIIYLLLSALTFGAYTVLAKKISMRTGSLAMNSLSFILGSVFLIPVLLFKRLPVFSMSFNIWPQMIYLTVFVTGLAYYSYFKGLALTDTSLGSMVFFIKPLLASLLAAISLGEKLTWGLLFGTLTVLASIYLVQRQTAMTVSR